MILLMNASAKARQDLISASTQEKTITDYEKLIDTLRKDTKDMTVIKDKLQDEMIIKMCIVVNSKKREIDRLNRRVAELETAAVQQREAASTLPIQSAEASAPREKPKARPAAKSTVAATKAAQRRATVKKPAANTARGRRTQQETSSSSEEVEDEDDTSDSSSPTVESQSSGREESRRQTGRSRIAAVATVTQPLSGTATASGASVAATQSSLGAPLSATEGGGVHAALPLHDSDSDELFLSKRRKTRAASPSAAAAPVSVSTTAPALSAPTASFSVAPGKVVSQPVSQVAQTVSLSQSSAGATRGGRLSKFLAEDSDEDENCLDFM